jgi:hypothetical protein
MSRVKESESLLAQEVEGLRYDRDMLLIIVHRFLWEHDALSMDNTGKICDRWPNVAKAARDAVKSIRGG